jgi:hypothetical protein
MNSNLNLIFLISFISYIHISKEIDVTLKAKTGIINKEINKEALSFIIRIDVTQNITNNITKTYFDLKIGKEIGNYDITSSCNIRPVRVAGGQTAETDLMCSVDISAHPDINIETELFVEPRTSDITSDEVTFKFENFDKISTLIEIGSHTLNYTKDDNECSNSHYIFEIINDNNISPPLQSMACKLALSGDEDHKEARCVVPVTGKIMKCSIDVSQKKYSKGSKIIIKKQGLIQCENGQTIEINSDSENELTISEECGNLKYINFNYLYLLFSFILL